MSHRSLQLTDSLAICYCPRSGDCSIGYSLPWAYGARRRSTAAGFFISAPRGRTAQHPKTLYRAQSAGAPYFSLHRSPTADDRWGRLAGASAPASFWVSAMIRALAAIAAILFLGTAQAEVGLVEVCLDGEQHDTSANRCPVGRRAWQRPSVGDAVLSCGSITDPAACVWGHAEFRYRRWELIPEDQFVQTCAADIEPGVFGAVDPCGSGGHSDGKPRIPKYQVSAGVMPGHRQVTVRWQHPTERIDGTELPIDEIANTMVFWGPDPGALESSPTERTVIVPSPESEVRISVSEGLVYFSARTIDTEGLMSELAQPVSMQVTIDPNAPEGLEVELWISGDLSVGEDTDAWGFYATRNAIPLFWVGTVPTGTPCDSTQGVNGLYVVPREAVNLDIDGDGFDESDPEAVVARCSAN